MTPEEAIEEACDAIDALGGLPIGLDEYVEALEEVYCHVAALIAAAHNDLDQP